MAITKIILGSQSPRRRELMAGIMSGFSIPYSCISIEADESYPSDLKGAEVASYIAEQKAIAYENQLASGELLITADTIVCLGDEILGKPSSKEEAKAMLSKLSGRAHEVYTAVYFTWKTTTNSLIRKHLVDVTTVQFNSLSNSSIEHYVEEYQPLDKAGAYGVQEWIGYIGIKHISGSYYNVMGFPTDLVYQWLVENLCSM